MLHKLFLNLFAEGGEAGVSGSDAGTGPSAEGSSAEPVVSEYEEFIKAHKEEDDKRIQSIVQKRLRGSKENEAKLEKAMSALNVLSGKYGVNAGDLDAITKAIENDASLYEEKALERGVTPDVEMYIQQLERQTKADEAMRKQQEQEAEQQRIIEGWMRDAEEARKVYPNFDFKTEMASDKFRQLIAVPGVSMATAYEVMHPEVVRGRTAAQVADNIKAKSQRPTEGGASKAPGGQAKVDIANASKEQLAEWSERARRGEVIDFVNRF